MGRGRVSSEGGFRLVFGRRRGHVERMASDHDWASLLTRPGVTPSLLAQALLGDLESSSRAPSLCLLRVVGASSTSARRVVSHDDWLHLLPAPWDEDGEVNAEALCGKGLLRSSVRRVPRGEWAARSRVEGASVCSRCGAHEGEVPEASEEGPALGMPPFLPERQDAFASDLAALCREQALEIMSQDVTPAQAQAMIDGAYGALLGEHARRALEQEPKLALRGLWPDASWNALERELLYELGLERMTNWKEDKSLAAVRDALATLDWASLLGPFVKEGCRGGAVLPSAWPMGSRPGIPLEARWRKALLAALLPRVGTRLAALQA